LNVLLSPSKGESSVYPANVGLYTSWVARSS
jgi:hypothetical protein